MKPILFNTEMVRAILDGRKTVTRRVIKPQPTECLTCGPNWIELLASAAAPYRVGDVLYVRETWAIGIQLTGGIIYKADCRGKPPFAGGEKWRPSIHMPKEAARLFLRVTDVRVERLQDITEEHAKAEGCIGLDPYTYQNSDFYDKVCIADYCVSAFAGLWNSTVKKSDLPLYGWEANPWVWIIEFERCEKP